MQTRRTESGRSRLSVAATSCAVLVLAGGLVLSVVAWGGGAVTGRGDVISESPETREPQGELEGNLRHFPLRSEPDPVARAFPQGLTDEATVTQQIVELAEPLGLGDSVLGLIAEPDPFSGLDFFVTGADGRPSYPFQYPLIDPVVAEELDLGAAADDPGALLDLTALLTLAAADDRNEPAWSRGAALAYSVLNRALTIGESCDFRLQLAHLVTLGQWPWDGHVEAATDAAREACPTDDPTPGWLRAHYRATWAVSGSFGQDLGPTAAEQLALALADFEILLADFPDSPLGAAGLADLLLDRADHSEQLGLRPFQVRSWRREALSLYEKARARFDDPGLALGHARALRSLGHLETALDVLDDVPDEAATSVAVLAEKVAVLQEQHDFAGVVGLLDGAAPTFPTGLVVEGNRRTSAHPAGYGSLGATNVAVYDPSEEGVGGAGTADHHFMPLSRRAWSPSTGCLDAAARSALVLLGEPGRAAEVAALGPENPNVLLPCLDELASGQDQLVMFDAGQDLARWAGDLELADQAIALWLESAPDDFVALQRAGEVAYWQRDYETAVARFEQAIAATRSLEEGVANPNYEGYADPFARDNPSAQMRLQLAETHRAMGDYGTAAESLEETLHDLQSATDDYEDPVASPGAQFAAQSLLGEVHLLAGHDEAAIVALRVALAVAQAEADEALAFADPSLEGDPPTVIRTSGAQHSNLALALARVGEHDTAIAMAEAALAHDPVSPLFTDTLAFAHHLAGNTDEAVAAYERTMDFDDTSYVSANNLAVLLAEDGKLRRAEELLRSALRSAPEYAIAWHNLGVVTARAGGSLLVSERAFAAAGRISRDLRGESLELVVDDAVYDSGLDISKPLSPDWSYAESSSTPSRGFALTMLLLLLLRGVWSLGLDRFSESAVTRVAAMGEGPGVRRRFWTRVPTAAALLVSVGVLALPSVSWSASWFERGVLAAIIAALVVLPLCVRRLIEPSGVAHFGWTPAIALAAIAAPFGVMIAPYPGIAERGRELPRRALWWPVATVGLVTAAFAVVALFSAVPLARFVAMAGAALVASMLLPVFPFDGSRLKSRGAGLLVTLVLGTATVAFALNWV